MKTKFKFLMAAATLAVGFSSCSNDNDGDAAFDGKSTGLRIAIPKVSTYADANAKAAEVAFKSATIFVFNGGSLEKDTTILAADFAANGDKYQMTKPMSVLSGTKNVYVGLNLTAADITAVRNGLYSPYTVTVPAITSDANGFAMFSTNGSNSFAIAADDTTEITVPVERWVAKVTSRVAASINTEASNAAINTFSFALGQVNTKMFPFQKLLASGVIEDPNWSGYENDGTGAYGPSEFVNEFGTNATINTAAYLPVDDEATTAPSRKTKYALENTSDLPKQGNTTFISVRAQFTPNAYHTFDGTTLANATAPGSVPANLYVVEQEDGTTYYFQVQSEAVAYQATVANAKIGHYKNGLCYYFIFLEAKNSSNSYATLRNAYFDSKITKVNSLGYPDPEVPNPDEQLAEYTDLTVEVEILPWEVVLSEDELGKI